MFDRFVLHNARRSGETLAFGGMARQCSFARLEASVSRVARILQNLKELPSPLIAVQCPDLWRHWIIILALSRLGLTSVSLPDADVSEEILSLLKPDLIIQHEGDLPHSPKSLVLGHGWFQKALSGVESDGVEAYFPPCPVDPRSACRVAIAAGTDKNFHALSFSFGDIETAILRLIYQDSAAALELAGKGHKKPDLLCTLGAASHSAFLMMSAALASATTIREANNQNVGSEVARGHPLFVVMTPSHLEHLIKALPPGMKPLSHLSLTVVGASLSDRLLQEALTRLTPHIAVAYGTDECGLVTEISASQRGAIASVGSVLPWASVEIVGEDDVPLPVGETGSVRIRTVGMAQSYRGEPGYSRQRFKGGWFYPGDRGSLSPQRELHITGRSDDLVALGGAKFDLSVIDSIIKANPVIIDAASFLVANEKGDGKIYCALINHQELAGEEVSKALRKRYPDLPPVTVIWVEAIPYKEDGFVDRQRLKNSVSVYLKAKELDA
ncbi:class I adenylate-forming enzyme family protein [Acetobacteraceae bacterium ESL0709]|nr:class I adenylate-forming enzyme family protein [Acetobacteraceae bacterium ESL0697]MDF7678939.1 class I adenylate-forming enzyme family protein [Acetobacteraceae bacterium ESL0709]